MKTLVYDNIPDYAKEIRRKVFIDEQGFYHEFDNIDEVSVHIVMFNEYNTPVATCRIFWDSIMNSYILGRIAVVKEYRSKNIGSAMVKEAEKYVQKNKGKSIALHSQCRITTFYQKLGFAEFGDVDDEEGCPLLIFG